LIRNYKKILYTAAFNEGNHLAYAKDAPRKRPYICVNCGNPMKVRRGPINRPHFAHLNKAFDLTCNPETVLHKCFKIALHERFQEHIEKLLPLQIAWHCLKCGRPHDGNFLKIAKSSKLEYDMVDFIADVGLLSNDQKIYCAVEVAVTNPPKEEKLAYYIKNEIWLVVFKLISDEDLDKVKETPLNPTSFDFCPSAFRNKENEPATSNDFDIAIRAKEIPIVPQIPDPLGTSYISDKLMPTLAGIPIKIPIIKTMALLLLLAIAAVAVLFIWTEFIK